jgi:phosphoglycolate phosphatase-like HAD superfamily hydrolase
VLLLFDIDGTLLRGAHVEHREALHAALTRVYGIADPAAAPVEAAGRTDIEIARLIALHRGVEAGRIDSGMADLRVAVAQEYAALVPADLSDRVADGIPELLAGLAERPGVALSLVTGNLEAVARMKLHAAGLGGRFPAGQGGFGSDHEDRTLLPAVARVRAGAPGEPYPRERTIVIGDTPRDIACARADGLRCVAVAGGPYRVEELADADAAVADARSLASALEPLL